MSAPLPEELPRSLHRLFREIRQAPPVEWATLTHRRRSTWGKHARWFLQAQQRPGVNSEAHVLYLLHQRLRAFRSGEPVSEARWGDLSKSQRSKYRKRAQRLRDLLAGAHGAAPESQRGAAL